MKEKQLLLALLCLLAISFLATPICADDLSGASAPKMVMVEDEDGIVGPNEYRRISQNGGTTRRPCPYTCEMRGVPRDHCREWKSKEDPSECYVEDTSVPSNAVPLK